MAQEEKTQDNTTSTTKNEIKNNGQICGDEIVEIVKQFDETDLTAIVKETGKTIKATLENSAKFFNSFAQGHVKKNKHW